MYQFYSEAIKKYKIVFENKIKQLRSLNVMNFIDSYTFLEIDRNYIFRDAFDGIMTKSIQELRQRLAIVYKGEEGIDAGGLLRYLYTLILNINQYLLFYINNFNNHI